MDGVSCLVGIIFWMVSGVIPAAVTGRGLIQSIPRSCMRGISSIECNGWDGGLHRWSRAFPRPRPALASKSVVVALGSATFFHPATSRVMRFLNFVGLQDLNLVYNVGTRRRLEESIERPLCGEKLCALSSPSKKKYVPIRTKVTLRRRFSNLDASVT